MVTSRFTFLWCDGFAEGVTVQLFGDFDRGTSRIIFKGDWPAYTLARNGFEVTLPTGPHQGFWFDSGSFSIVVDPFAAGVPSGGATVLAEDGAAPESFACRLNFPRP